MKISDFYAGRGWRSNVSGHNMKSGTYVENITVRQFIAQVCVFTYRS